MIPSQPSAHTGERTAFFIRNGWKHSPPNPEVEQMLCARWHDHHDTSAAQRLIDSHSGLVLEIAMAYRGYGVPLDDLIGEGYVGLMHAVCRFDPDSEVRFATCAIWWMCTAIQKYILENTSFVKPATIAC